MAILTQERLEEIREWHQTFNSQNKSHPFIGDLLTEIDALREEKDGLYADLIGQEHLMGSKIEVLEAENDKLKDKVRSLLDHIEDLEG